VESAATVTNPKVLKEWTKLEQLALALVVVGI